METICHNVSQSRYCNVWIVADHDLHWIVADHDLQKSFLTRAHARVLGKVFQGSAKCGIMRVS